MRKGLETIIQYLKNRKWYLHTHELETGYISKQVRKGYDMIFTSKDLNWKLNSIELLKGELSPFLKCNSATS